MNEQKVKETIEDFKEIVLMSSAMGFDITSGQCDLIIEALEKQLPKRVVDKSLVKDNGSVLGSIGRCPNCKEIIDDGTIVCDCGQKLDWSE